MTVAVIRPDPQGFGPDPVLITTPDGDVIAGPRFAALEAALRAGWVVRQPWRSAVERSAEAERQRVAENRRRQVLAYAQAHPWLRLVA